jgi:PAT family beta-lactamase induction signal transducer AmpG
VGTYALAIALASATQDIAVDAYAVEVLKKEEQGTAVGARTAFYRAAMLVAGNFSIWLAARWSWPVVLIGLGLLYLPTMLVTLRSPEPEYRALSPRTLREAVWLPFLGFLSRHRALEILAFVVCYKLADNLAGALVSPFLQQMGYDETARGFWRGWISMGAVVGGTFVGGALTDALGLGRALWVFGLLQIVSNVGYVFVAQTGVNLPLMFGAVGFEAFTTGLGTGAFFVLLLRLTQKRFSATQYALFSSLFGISRIASGPICGFLVDALGWKTFFAFTIAAGIPGMVLLSRFVPWGVREPEIDVEAPPPRPALGRAGYAWRFALGGAAGLALAALAVATLDALKASRATPGSAFDLAGPLRALVAPATGGEWVATAGVIVVAGGCALFAAAVAAARRGAFAEEEPS